MRFSVLSRNCHPKRHTMSCIVFGSIQLKISRIFDKLALHTTPLFIDPGEQHSCQCINDLPGQPRAGDNTSASGRDWIFARAILEYYVIWGGPFFSFFGKRRGQDFVEWGMDDARVT